MLTLLQAASDFMVDAQPMVGPGSGTVIGSIIASLLGAGGIVKLYQAWSQNKIKKAESRAADGVAFREALQSRVVELEDKVDFLSGKIETMITMYADKILNLSTENATLKANNENLESENADLRAEIRVLKN